MIHCVKLLILAIICVLPWSMALSKSVEGQSKENVAVMELKNSSGAKKREVTYLTSVVRQAASRLPHSKYFIMTRDNIQTMLPPGKSLEDCVGECAVETARNISAHWLVTGEVIRFGKELRISLSLLNSKSGGVRDTKTVKGKKLSDLETPLQAAALFMFASIDPSLTKQAERIKGGFVFKKTVMPEFIIQEAQIDEVPVQKAQVREPESVEIPLPTFKASGFEARGAEVTTGTSQGEAIRVPLDEPLPMPKYQKDELDGVNFGNVDVEALQAYDEAVKGDQNESVSAKEKIQRWTRVSKVFKKKKREAKERIKVWKAYQRAEQKRLKALAKQEAREARLAKIRAQEEALEEVYEEAVRVDQDESASVKEKIKQWKVVQKKLKSKKKEAQTRIKAWTLYEKKRKAEQARVVKARKKRAVDLKRAKKARKAKLMKVYKKGNKKFDQLNRQRDQVLKAEKKRRDRDWKKLSKLLPLSVVSDEDKVKWVLAFIEAYGVVDGLNPYANKRVVRRYIGQLDANVVAEIKVQNEAEMETRRAWMMQKAKYAGFDSWVEARRLEAERKAEQARMAKMEDKRSQIESNLKNLGLNIIPISIPGGSFNMGSENGDSDEKPVHRIKVKSFYLSKTEVTVGQYRACVKAGACSKPSTGSYCNWNKSDREDHPINCVDWNQARTFAKWVGGDLPSEAQWEYAARSGGKDWKYPWGNESASCEYAVMDDGGDGCGKDRTWAVCSKPKGNSKQGLCDMAGGVWEWVRDEYKLYDSNKTDDLPVCQEPTCRSNDKSRVRRGGSWVFNAGRVRAADRYYWGSYRNYNLGFRLLLGL